MLIKRFLKNQINYKTPGTIAWKMRQRRMSRFNEWFDGLAFDLSKTEVKILDVGGVPDYWKYLGFNHINAVRITSLNLDTFDVPDEFKNTMTSVKGNAINMQEFEDQTFDIVFSNSVIEHVGEFDNQKKMAHEMLRIAPHGYLQTPNKGFFIEPHFLFPFFQFLPHRIREDLCLRFQMGYFKKASTREEAKKTVDDVHLLTYKQLKILFPNARIYKEKWMGMTKSFELYW